MIETETKTMGRRQKRPSYPGVQNFARPSVRPSEHVFFNVRPRFSMSVRVFECPSDFCFNVRPSVSINSTKNNLKINKNKTCSIKKRQKTTIRYFRIAISTTPFLTRLARIDRAHCQLSICAVVVENGDV